VFGRPGGEHHAASWPQHAPHLGDGHVGPRREHVAELARHHIERGVGVGQRLGITLLPLHVHPRDARVVSRLFEQRGRQVDGLHLRTGACRRNGHDSRAGSHVQQLLAGRDSPEGDQPSCHGRGEDGGRGKRTPHLALTCLESGKGVGAGHGALLVHGAMPRVAA